MRIGRSTAALILSVAFEASAAELDVAIDDTRGHAAEDAVVTVRDEAGSAPSTHAAVTRIVDQRNETFIPYVEIFRPGDSVVFRNSDRTRHHVYSFAPAKSFEFVIAPGASTPAVVLDQAGEIAVGCNIHDRMITHLYVSDAPWIAKTDADGHAVFRDLPPGRYEVRVWHPQLRPGREEPRQIIDVGAATTAAKFSLSLLPDPRPAAEDRERARY